MAEYAHGYWWSRDGLRLHYRDYPGGADKPPILCIPGLTRNARDFEHVADRLAGGWRVICVDLRGRGESAYAKDPMTYVPLTYLHDIEALLTELELGRVILFGTSLGGLLTMLLSATDHERIAGALLNDVGPTLEPAGLAHIGTYVGKQASYISWVQAARALQGTFADVYPDYDLAAWLRMAKRLCRLNAQGRITFDYDMKIAEPFRTPAGAVGIDMWPAFDSLSDVPTTLLRGARSTLLSPATVEEMAVRNRSMDIVTIPRIGHAPVLDEPESWAAIDHLLARIVAAAP